MGAQVTCEAYVSIELQPRAGRAGTRIANRPGAAGSWLSARMNAKACVAMANKKKRAHPVGGTN